MSTNGSKALFMWVVFKGYSPCTVGLEYGVQGTIRDNASVRADMEALFFLL